MTGLPRETCPNIVVPTWQNSLVSLRLLLCAKLSMMLFAIIGGFWLLDSLKDTVLDGTIGIKFLPTAKLVSVVVTLLLVLQYNRLVDACGKPTVSSRPHGGISTRSPGWPPPTYSNSRASVRFISNDAHSLLRSHYCLVW